MWNTVANETEYKNYAAEIPLFQDIKNNRDHCCKISICKNDAFKCKANFSECVTHQRTSLEIKRHVNCKFSQTPLINHTLARVTVGKNMRFCWKR